MRRRDEYAIPDPDEAPKNVEAQCAAAPDPMTVLRHQVEELKFRFEHLPFWLTDHRITPSPALRCSGCGVELYRSDTPRSALLTCDRCGFTVTVPKGSLAPRGGE